MVRIEIRPLMELLDIMGQTFQLSANIVDDAELHRKALRDPDARVRWADVPKCHRWLRWVIGNASEMPCRFCRSNLFLIDCAFYRYPQRPFINMLGFIRI